VARCVVLPTLHPPHPFVVFERTGERLSKPTFDGARFATLGGMASTKKTRDPKGGLTAAGREEFRRKEGAHLRPGVRGKADTPEKMRRKGSFLRRMFAHDKGPLVDEHGEPTRRALSAHAWGEPVPRTKAAAKKLAEKGKRLLERYERTQEMAAKKKNSLVGNINRRKKAGTSRPKSKSTVSKKSYSAMEAGWPKKKGAKKRATKKSGTKKSATKKRGTKKSARSRKR
jgi:hypothetical protein